MTSILKIIYPKTSFPQVPYSIKLGISQKHVLELIDYTNTDPFFKNNTSDLLRVDGSLGRFSNLFEYQKWLDRGKYIYTLISPNNDLMGIIWFSQEKPNFDSYMLTEQFDHDHYSFTFAIRLYSAARGVGLAKQFASIATTHFTQSDSCRMEPRNGIWLDVKSTNLAAISIYKGLGFKQVGTNLIEKSLLMLQYQSL